MQTYGSGETVHLCSLTRTFAVSNGSRGIFSKTSRHLALLSGLIQLFSYFLLDNLALARIRLKISCTCTYVLINIRSVSEHSVTILRLRVVTSNHSAVYILFRSFEISDNILRNQNEVIGLDSYSRQVFIYLDAILIYVSP